MLEQPFFPFFCSAIFESYVLPPNIAEPVQRIEKFLRRLKAGKEKSDLSNICSLLLRLDTQAKRREQDAYDQAGHWPLTSDDYHRITLSALASTLGGMVKPICLAALRLMTNSNFVGCSTGRSAGLAPLSILSTYVAARLSRSLMLAP